MKKKLFTILICSLLIIGITGCDSEESISLTELSRINDQIIAYFQSDNVEYHNLSYNYVDETNRVVIVGLLNNSKEEQDKFRELVVDSEYIKFVEGENLVNY